MPDREKLRHTNFKEITGNPNAPKPKPRKWNQPIETDWLVANNELPGTSTEQEDQDQKKQVNLIFRGVEPAHDSHTPAQGIKDALDTEDTDTLDLVTPEQTEREEAQSHRTAAFERPLLAERIRTGREVVRRRGVRFGPKPKLSEPDLEHAQTLIEQGRPVPEIAALFNVHHTALYRAFNRVLPTPPSAQHP